MSIDGWMDKEDVVYIHNEIFSHKKEWNSAICREAGGDLTQTGECTLTMVTEIPWSQGKECLQPPEAGRGKKWIIYKREQGLSGTLILLFSHSVMSNSLQPHGLRMLGFPVHHQLLELAQTHVHRVSDAIQPSHPLSSAAPAFSLAQHQGLFQWVSSLHQVAKVLEF